MLEVNFIDGFTVTKRNVPIRKLTNLNSEKESQISKNSFTIRGLSDQEPLTTEEPKQSSSHLKGKQVNEGNR